MDVVREGGYDDITYLLLSSMHKPALLTSPVLHYPYPSLCPLIICNQIQALLEAGADLTDIDRSNANCLHLAVRGQREVSKGEGGN